MRQYFALVWLIFMGTSDAFAVDVPILFSDSFEPVFVSSNVPAVGGSVSLPGAATVIFSQDAFVSDTLVIVHSPDAKGLTTLINDTATMFRPLHRTQHSVEISVFGQPPATGFVTVVLDIPRYLQSATPVTHRAEAFVKLVNNGGEETVEILDIADSVLDPASGTLTASVPSAAFLLRNAPLNQYTATLLIMTTPGVNASMVMRAGQTNTKISRQAILDRLGAVAGSTCQAQPVACPLGQGCVVTSPFSPARQHPVIGDVRPHNGVDYRASNGSSVLAAASGTVELSRTTNGYGRTIVLRHTDGSATLYAHLQSSAVTVGQRVQAGQQIALSNNSGRSTGPHLHFEYVPNGQIFGSKRRIDPQPCVDGVFTGSITVRDNGSAADDAFRVFFDGITIGETAIGQANQIALNNVIPGNHVLGVQAIIAPDNVGTYEIRLNDGIVFQAGGTVISGILELNELVEFTIIVP